MLDKAHLLLAEDDQVIRVLLDQLLQTADYTVDFAKNGQEAVELWEKGNCALILMDVQMPDMNGVEATIAIREIERTRGGHIPIVAMTAHAHEEDKNRCLVAGMDTFISKPFDFDKSLQVIEEILSIGKRPFPDGHKIAESDCHSQSPCYPC